MGFFRFRRSIRILPGVRWNIGKRSSSVSFGGRGFHYTIGTHGTRTTVGVPGTGLSYTSTSGTHQTSARRPPIDPDQLQAWSAKQQETFHLEVPDKESGEELATQKQIDCIHDLVRNIQGVDFASLGKKQASAIIDSIKAEKDRFTERKAQEYLAMQKRHSGLVTLLWIGAIIFLLVHFGMIPWVNESGTKIGAKQSSKSRLQRMRWHSPVLT